MVSLVERQYNKSVIANSSYIISSLINYCLELMCFSFFLLNNRSIVI